MYVSITLIVPQEGASTADRRVSVGLGGRQARDDRGMRAMDYAMQNPAAEAGCCMGYGPREPIWEGSTISGRLLGLPRVIW